MGIRPTIIGTLPPLSPEQLTTSELNPCAETTLITRNALSLAHDHDVEAVENGTYRLYFGGKVSYRDVTNGQHELHFCRYYQPVKGLDPLKLNECESYNETKDLSVFDKWFNYF